jgi:uroporphyrinogen decarboxylase
VTGMSERENFIRAIEFGSPEWIPCTVSVTPAVWKKLGRDLRSIMEEHPRLFPSGFPKAGMEMHEHVLPGEHRDGWGCVWRNLREGLHGQVVVSPLADWNALDAFVPPDPLVTGDLGEPVD